MSSFESPNFEPYNPPEFTVPDDVLGALATTEASEQESTFESLAEQLARLEKLGGSNRIHRIAYHAGPIAFGLENGHRRVLLHAINDNRHGPLQRVIVNDTIRNWQDDGSRLAISDFVVSALEGSLTTTRSQLSLAHHGQRWECLPETGPILHDRGLSGATGSRQLILENGRNYRTRVLFPGIFSTLRIMDLDNFQQQKADAHELTTVLTGLNEVTYEPVDKPKVART